MQGHRIDRTSPVPIYHQIAEALRNAIATGELTADDRLPPVRTAAEEWGVNLHTVRKAYGELAREGLVRIRGARGTTVAAGEPGAVPARELDTFLASWLGSAHERFGLTQVQLGQLLLKRAAAGMPPTVHVLECSREQAEGHAEELMRVWRVAAKALVLTEATELPAGILIGTYFHYNDIRQRWPQRLDEVRFVAIAPDDAIARRLPIGGRKEARRRLLVCELDGSKAVNIAADLKNVFGDVQYRIEPRVLPSPLRLPAVRHDDVLLVSPRVWGVLTERQRARVVPIRYSIRTHEIENLGRSLGWERAAVEASA
jgi:GntR family transcriptional regulator